MEWSLAQRVGLRFACLYLFLFIFPFPMGILPGAGWLGRGYKAGWRVIVPWVGKHVLHLDTDITVFTNGSGDTTYNYVQVLCFLVLAAAGAALWSVLDRRRTRYARIHDLLRIYVRWCWWASWPTWWRSTSDTLPEPVAGAGQPGREVALLRRGG